MKTKTLVSGFAVMTALAAVASFDAHAAVRVNSKSRAHADAYNQVNTTANSRPNGVATVTSGGDNTTNPAAVAVTGANALPVRVANPAMAQRIANDGEFGDVNLQTLERCSKIYPNGEFAWDTPTAGLGRGGASTCVAVVEMRAPKAAPDGSDVVLARANVAAGSVAKCNISEFPEYGYTDAAYEFVFPADDAPTMADVEKVMNAEQKQNAGFKIAASALIGVIGGNMMGKNDVGHDGMFGTDKGKVQGSVIGGLAGAAIGAGSAYGGKVGGDMILSGGVNAAAGGIMANAIASGDSVLRIEECDVGGKKTTCLWGYVMKKTVPQCGLAGKQEDCVLYYEKTSGATLACDSAGKNCDSRQLVNISIGSYASIDAAKAAGFKGITFDRVKCAEADKTTSVTTKGQCGTGAETGEWAQIASASEPGQKYAAMIPDFKDGTFGKSESDWTKWKSNHSGARVVARGANGTEDKTQSQSDVQYNVENFSPVYLSADDGAVIDLGNKARMKTTMVGAGAGGALGAFSAYQGAKSDISERWFAATEEYKDSLNKIICVTGTGSGGRFLASYNSDFEIPNMPEPTITDGN